MNHNRLARAPGAPVPEFRVEFVYDDPYDDPVESFDWTLEQLANTIRTDDLEWNPDFRAFDQNQPLLTSEFQDVRGNSSAIRTAPGSPATSLNISPCWPGATCPSR